jgi:Spy/CpxP family protein refolding chaperone
MKTLYRMTGIAALLAATVLAQRPFGVVTSGTPPDPATIVANKVERLTKLLTLSTSQASQASTIFTNALSLVTPIETSLRTDRQSLQTAVKANDVATIESVSTNIGSLTGQILTIQNKADAAFYAILTTTQQNTLNQSRGFGRGFGRRGNGPAAGQ